MNTKERLNNWYQTITRCMRCMDYTSYEFLYHEEVHDENRKSASYSIQNPSLEQKAEPDQPAQPEHISHFAIERCFGREARLTERVKNKGAEK